MDTNIYQFDREEMLDSVKLDPTDAITLCLNCTRENCKGTCAAVEAILNNNKRNYTKPTTRKVKTYTYNGLTKTRKEWANYFGVKYASFEAMVIRRKDVIEAIKAYEQIQKQRDALGA